MALIDDFESYSDGNLGGQGSWTDDYGHFIVGTTNPNTGSKCIHNDASGVGSSKSFTASAQAVQSFYMRVNAINDTDRFYMTPYTGASYIGEISFWQSAGGTRKIFMGYNGNIGQSGALLLSGANLNQWYKIEFEWDGTASRGAGGTGKIRARVDGGSWTSWQDSTNSFSTVDSITINTVLDSAYPTNAVFYDDFSVTVSGPANLKSWNGLATASIKSINGLAIASLKKVNGLA